MASSNALVHWNSSLMTSRTCAATGCRPRTSEICTDGIDGSPIPCSCARIQRPLLYTSTTETYTLANETSPSGVPASKTVGVGSETLYLYTTHDTEIDARKPSIRPPTDCCKSMCSIQADEVGIIYWPVDDVEGNKQGQSNDTTPKIYTTVSNGFTL